MATPPYSLTFRGYWLKSSCGNMPCGPGIYSVYVCQRDNTSEDTVELRKLLYIGEADNVRDRIATHEKWAAWEKHLDQDRGEDICFSFASTDRHRERAEAALIHEHKPPENDEYVTAFPFAETTVHAVGANALLHEFFTVSGVADHNQED